MKIKVIHPFSLRTGSGKPVREFPAGVHAISKEEHGHWFLKACIKEGRAVPLADEDTGEDSDELTAPTKDELMKLNREQLDALAVSCGVDSSGLATKANVCALLLAGHEGITLVKGPDGIFVQTGDSVPQA